jgi:hypothetical protein
MNSSLRRAFAALRKARITGYASACFWVLAVLFLLDGLQMLMRTDFNRIDLSLGEQVLLSGAMPLHAKEHSEIVASIEGDEGLSFTTFTDFKGLWFGAHMWRGALDASAAAGPGRAVLTVLDMVPAKSTTRNATIMVQNPNLVYVVTLWPSKEAMQAAHLSLNTRLTGLSPFLLAALSLACALSLGVLNAYFNTVAHNALAREGLFAVQSMRTTDAGYLTTFAPGTRCDLQARQPMLLLTPQGEARGKGVVTECSRFKGCALFPLDGVPPRYGWLLRYEPHREA